MPGGMTRDRAGGICSSEAAPPSSPWGAGRFPEEYDAWYRTPRGRWIGAVEYRLLGRLLSPRTDETLLDVGCGTGHFTRGFAAVLDGRVVGLDPSDSE